MRTKDEEFLARLQAAFRAEAEEHVQAMSSGLLQLEGLPPAEERTPIIESVYREAHSLKGAARAVNMTEIEAVCQSLENVFSSWKRGEITPRREQFDILHRAVDSVAQLLDSAGGTRAAPAKEQIARLTEQLALLRTDTPARATAGTEPPFRPSVEASERPERAGALRAGPPLPELEIPVAAAPQEEPLPTVQDATPAPAEGSQAEPSPSGSGPAVQAITQAAPERAALAETVRISTAKLDTLLLQTEEMLAVKLTVGQRAAELREGAAMLDAWKKEWARVLPEVRGARQAMEREDGRHEPGQAALHPSIREAGTAGYPARLLDFLDWNQEHLRNLESKLAALVRAAEQDRRSLGGMVDNLLEETKRLLLLPFSALLEIFPKLVRDLSRDQGKEAQVVIRGQEVEIDKRIQEEMKDALIHLVRNCIDHGIERPEERVRRNKPPRGTVTIALSQVEGKVEILISDDGAGIDVEKVKAAAVRTGTVSEEEAAGLSDQEALSLIFQSDVSTSPIITEISGRGLGMAIVREKVEKLGGRVTVESSPGAGSAFRIVLPLTLATFRGLLIQAAGQLFVIPTVNIERVVRVRRDEIKTVENRETLSLDERAVSLARLEDVLELGRETRREEGPFLTLVVLGAGERRIAFSVDEVLNEQEVLIKSLGPLLARVRNVSGATVLGSGKAVPILNVADLMKSAVRTAGAPARAAAPDGEGEEMGRSILVAEDSITSRMLLKNILESAGYQVSTAVDGMDALTTLKTEAFDLVVSDVDMPRMDGFELTEKIRGDGKLAGMPVVLVTARETGEDRERGVEVGANAYIVKSSFDQSNLLDVVRRLI
jgi:two-component system, chemotaxis family, sensor kinase CheA